MNMQRLMPTTRLASRHFSTARALGVKSSLQSKAPTTYIVGDVNDPVVYPTPNKAHGSFHWNFERVLAVALVPLAGSSFALSANPVLDGVLASALAIHTHFGLDQVLIDYLHERKFPVIGPIVTWLLRIATGTVLFGIYQFNTNDIGLTELIKKVWKA